jgi:hypothetical protein
VVNPDVGVKVSTWQDGRKGALSVSVDDDQPSCYDRLVANGFKGTYFTKNPPPSFYTNYYYVGMELGAHLAYHPCYEVGDDELRHQLIEPNIHAI